MLSETSVSTQEVGKTKRGRPFGTKKGHIVTHALEAAKDAAVSIQEMDAVVSNMKDHQKLLFESIMSGDDELIAALKSGHTEWFTGITKKLFIVGEDGEEGFIMSTSLNLENVHSLHEDSYKRLLTICRSQVRKVTGEDDYRQYVEPIRDYIKRFAPMALGTIVGIAQTGIKEENRLKAAKDLLDRAGEREPEPDKDVVIPVQVNIMLTGDDGKVKSYVGSTER